MDSGSSAARAVAMLTIWLAVRIDDAGSSGRCRLLSRRGELGRVRKVVTVPDG